MKNTYRGEPEHKDDFSIEQFSLQVKRKALVFTSAGIACLIMTFSAYVIGMEEKIPTASDTQKQVISKEKSNISKHPVNNSQQLASADPSSQTSTTPTNSEETQDTSDDQNDGQDQTTIPTQNNRPPSSDQENHDLSDIVAIADSVEETPVYEKEDPPASNDDTPEQKPPKFEWNQPGFLDHLIPFKHKLSKDSSKANNKPPISEQHWIHLKPRHKDDDPSDKDQLHKQSDQTNDKDDKQIHFHKEKHHYPDMKKFKKHLRWQKKNHKHAPFLFKKEWGHKKSS